MNFLYPAVLWALSLLAIPIIIHLFRLRRYKTIYFSDLRFLKDIQKQTKNQSQLKHLLVLASRLLALAALILAFAQPFIPGASASQSPEAPIYIYLDNSPSMEAKGPQGDLLNWGKLKIRDIISTYGENHPYKWITNSNQTPSRNWLTGDQLRQESAMLKPASSFITMDEVLKSIATDAQNYEGDKRVFILSDFQNSFINAADEFSDTTLQIYPVHLANEVSIQNVSIDSIWFESPIFSVGFEQQLFAEITNHSENALENFNVRLLLNGTTKGTLLVALPANSTQKVSIKFTPNSKGSVTGMLIIEDSPVIFDDQFYFVMEVSETRKAYHIYEQQPASVISKILDDELVAYESDPISSVDLNKVKDADLIVLESVTKLPSGVATTIATQVQEGKNLIWLPAENFDIESYKLFSEMLGVGSFEATKTENVQALQFAFKDPYLTGVFQGTTEKLKLPEVTRWIPIKKRPGQLQYPLMTLSNGAPLVLRTENGGQVIQTAGPLNKDWNTLSNHPLLIPLIYQGVLFRQNQNPPYFISGSSKALSVQLDDTNTGIPLKITEGETAIIPSQQRKGNRVTIFMENGPQQPGHYPIDFAGQGITQVAVNIPREESITTYLTDQQITEYLEEREFTVFSMAGKTGNDFTTNLKELETGRILWPYFLIFALLMLLVESLLLRRFQQK